MEYIAFRSASDLRDQTKRKYSHRLTDEQRRFREKPSQEAKRRKLQEEEGESRWAPGAGSEQYRAGDIKKKGLMQKKTTQEIELEWERQDHSKHRRSRRKRNEEHGNADDVTKLPGEATYYEARERAQQRGTTPARERKFEQMVLRHHEERKNELSFTIPKPTNERMLNDATERNDTQKETRDDIFEEFDPEKYAEKMRKFYSGMSGAASAPTANARKSPEKQMYDPPFQRTIKQPRKRNMQSLGTIYESPGKRSNTSSGGKSSRRSSVSSDVTKRFEKQLTIHERRRTPPRRRTPERRGTPPRRRTPPRRDTPPRGYGTSSGSRQPPEAARSYAEGGRIPSAERYERGKKRANPTEKDYQDEYKYSPRR